LTRCMCEWNGRLDQAGVGEGAARKRSDLADCASVGAGGAGGEGGGV